jgi:hypothetical protein
MNHPCSLRESRLGLLTVRRYRKAQVLAVRQNLKSYAQTVDSGHSRGAQDNWREKMVEWRQMAIRDDCGLTILRLATNTPDNDSHFRPKKGRGVIEINQPAFRSLSNTRNKQTLPKSTPIRY